MRRAIFTLTLAVATATAPLPVFAGPGAADPQAEAKRLYEEGRTAYRLGNFADAVEKFEAAYAASGLPTILFNVGLAYERLYTTSADVAHLRKAVAVLENFLLEVQKDPSLGDPTEVENQIKTIKQKIEDHDNKEAARAAAAEEERRKAAEDARKQNEGGDGDGDVDAPTGPVGPDPGAGDRRLGAILMGVGGGVGVAGAAGAIAFGIQGQNFEDDLVQSYANSDAAGCVDPSDSTDCANLADQQEKLRNNGSTANTLTLAFGIGGGIAGIALIGAGAGIFMRGKNRTSKWKNGNDLSIAPTGRGFVISGRF